MDVNNITPRDNVSSIEKLDETLKAFNAAKFLDSILVDDGYAVINKTTIKLLLSTEGILIKDAELNRMLGKLVMDKNVIAHNDASYTITFDGELFIELGGYREKERRELESRDRLTRLENAQLEFAERASLAQENIRTLTVWIAIGAIVAAAYYGMEVVKFVFSLIQAYG